MDAMEASPLFTSESQEETSLNRSHSVFDNDALSPKKKQAEFVTTLFTKETLNTFVEYFYKYYSKCDIRFKSFKCFNVGQYDGNQSVR